MGEEQVDDLASAYRVLLRHLLKWRYRPEQRSGSWRAMIAEQRKRIAKVPRQNSGLRPMRAELFAEAYADAPDLAAAEMGLEVGVFPEVCEWGLERVCEEGSWLEGVAPSFAF